MIGVGIVFPSYYTKNVVALLIECYKSLNNSLDIFIVTDPDGVFMAKLKSTYNIFYTIYIKGRRKVKTDKDLIVLNRQLFADISGKRALNLSNSNLDVHSYPGPKDKVINIDYDIYSEFFSEYKDAVFHLNKMYTIPINNTSILPTNLKTILFIHNHVSQYKEVYNTLLRKTANISLTIHCYIKSHYDYIMSCLLTTNKHNSVFIEYISNNKTNGVFEDINEKKINYLKNSSIEHIIFIDNNIIFNDTLVNISDIIDMTKPVVSPFLNIYNKPFSNFWVDRTPYGYFKKRVCDVTTGYNISVYANYLIYINKSLISVSLKKDNIYSNDTVNLPVGDFDIVFSNFLYKHCIPIYTRKYTKSIGYLIESPIINEIHDAFIDIKDINNNRYMWEKKYLHCDLRDSLGSSNKPDYVEIPHYIYNINFFTEAFCEALIQKCEQCNTWSNGSVLDTRLQGGIEIVPTIDIHLNQIGFRKLWDTILNTYIAPTISKFYLNYLTKGTNIVFVVKYDMEGMKELSAHHDSSSYSINVALNDTYDGGGTHFVMQNKSIIKQKKGSLTFHPGKCTHYHKGLPITSGVRYILVGFID